MDIIQQNSEIMQGEILSGDCLHIINSAFKQHKDKLINIPLSDRDIFAKAVCQHYLMVDPNGLAYQRWKRMTKNCKKPLTENEKIRFKELCRIFKSEKQTQEFPVETASAGKTNTEIATSNETKPKRLLGMPVKTAKWVLAIVVITGVIILTKKYFKKK